MKMADVLELLKRPAINYVFRLHLESYGDLRAERDKAGQLVWQPQPGYKPRLYGYEVVIVPDVEREGLGEA